MIFNHLDYLTNFMSTISKKFILFSILTAILSISLFGCNHNKSRSIIESYYPSESAQITSFGWVGISFTLQMREASVENSFTLSPFTQGETFWQENTFWFRPIKAFERNTIYQARLSGQIKTAKGIRIDVDHAWSFTIREPALLFFVPADQGGEIWKAQDDGSDAKQLTFTDDSVFEFSPDRTGEWIVFTNQNASGGRDLWLVDRDGEDQRLLLDCGQDLCNEPAWSIDGKTIAYTREIFQGAVGGYQPGQIWTVDIESGQTKNLYESDSVSGYSPSFSPDGKKLAFYDTANNGIRIQDLTSSQDSFVPRSIQGSGDWSPDGSKLIFTDHVAAENEPFIAVYTVDLESNVVESALDIGAADTDFSQPRWSPNGDWVAVSLRPVNSNISKTLWALRLDGLVSRRISDDLSATYTAYQWDPWGKCLVYQRYELSSSNSSIWVWDSGESVQIIENGARPKWLP